MRLVPLLLIVALAACKSGTPASGAAGPVHVRLGYFANLTHAPAMVALDAGYFREELGANTLEARIFNAGPEVVEAIFSGALDVSYVGPNPAINAFSKSNGEAIRIVAGATSGGAALVVHPSITEPAQLRGKKLASPQRGNTQDVALRAWLHEHGLAASLEGAGDVAVLPQPNAQTLETFREGQIDGAWVPEPWATRLVVEGGGKVLVDERTLWPEGKFVATHVIVRTAFLREHPQTVEALMRAHVRAIELLNAQPDATRDQVNAVLQRVTGKALPPEILRTAWSNLAFTTDPLGSTLKKSAAQAKVVGLLGAVSLDGIYDLTAVNNVLAARGGSRIPL